eukprot:Polyplicarium_translucidae@DN1352_c0_g1_i1.p1
MNHPMPETSGLENAALFVSLGLATVPATWGALACREVQSGTKDAQHLAGASVFMYWLSALLWDVVSYVPLGAIVFLLLALFSVDELMNFFGQSCVLLLSYPFAAAPFAYLFTFIVDSPVAAQVIISLFGWFLPLLSSMLMFITATRAFYDRVLRWIFMLMPTMALLEGLSNLAYIDSDSEPWSWEMVGYPLTYIWCTCVGYFLLVVILDIFRVDPSHRIALRDGCRSFFCARRHKRLSEQQQPFYPDPDLETDTTQRLADGRQYGSCLLEDTDVTAERRRAHHARTNLECGEPPALLVAGMRKVYRPTTRQDVEKVAVNNLWFAVDRATCFGFLGVNGAGKTTTTKMITGKILPSSGTAFVDGFNIVDHSREARRALGFCPQFDTLFPALNAKEHISFYGRLTGVPESFVKQYCAEVLEAIDMSPSVASRPSKALSCGNRRKLSLALALIGDPALLIVDEPTSGVDPVSRRKLWALLYSMRESGRAIVLASHSMDECEALCDRIGILKNGRLICVGSPGHIKAKFGEGYQLFVTLQECAGEVGMRNLVQSFFKGFPGTTLVEAIGPTNLHFHVPAAATSLATLFQTVELLKDSLLIKEYGVSPTSLEQVFVNLSQ